jgi:hypothetical protein
MPRVPHWVVLSALLQLTLACSESGEDVEKKTTPVTCDAAPGYATEVAAQRIGAVSATLLDTSGAPANDLLVQVCGLDLCVNGNTQPSGSASVSVQAQIKKPAFKYGTGTDFARLAFPLPNAEDIALGTVTAVKLPSFADGAPLVPGKSATSGGVTLELDARTTIDFDSLVYPEASEQTLRVTRILAEHNVQAIDKTLGLDLVFAAAPVETAFCPPAKLSVVNELQWDAGTPVEVFIHGVSVEEQWAPYAGWAKVAEGVVSADGARIETPNGGLPLLSTFGIRKKK